MIVTADGAESISVAADRAAVERVYYNHRLGTKPPFEQTLTAGQIEKMVRLDQKKEVILKKIYRVEIKDAEIDAEMQRIETTTKAPETLQEIKAALGNDPKRFAATVVRPIVIERKLRERFQNDDTLHRAQRQQAERVREKLLAAKNPERRFDLLKTEKQASPIEITWRFTAPANVVASSASYSIEATAQISPVLDQSQPSPNERSFEEVDPELQNILRAQLQKPGDVTAVIETPVAFLLFVTKEKSNDKLRVGSLSFSKRGYEEWLAAQPD
jgi:hypothetical protein